VKITEKIIDLVTGQETITEREESEAEKSIREKNEAAIADELTIKNAAAQDKAALLSKLGITEDEARLLLS